MDKIKPILNGKVHQAEYDEWIISWEAESSYRHWCRQQKKNTDYKKDILIIMFNPGSLSADGRNLGRDTTLRILRRVFEHIPANCLVTNLYDFATPNPDILINKFWNDRDLDPKQLIYNKLDHINIITYMFAYGNYQNCGIVSIEKDIKKRIKLIEEFCNPLKQTEYFKNLKSNTPKHPFSWQPEGLILQARNKFLKTIILHNEK